MPKQPTEQEIMEHNLTHTHTHALQIMVSHLHTGTWQIRCTSTTKQQTHHTNRFCISKRHWESVPNTGTNSHRYRDRPLFCNFGSQQSNNDGLLCKQHHCLHQGSGRTSAMVQSDNEQRTISHGIGYQRYQVFPPAIHQPTAHEVKVASRHCIELSLDKHVSPESTSEPTTVSMLACNIQSCRGSSSTALFSVTTTPSIAMEYQVTSGDGSQTTRLPSVSLEKAFSTCHHQPSSNIPNLRKNAIQASGLERTRHQENPLLGLEARSSKQEPSGDKSNHGITMDNWWTSSVVHHGHRVHHTTIHISSCQARHQHQSRQKKGVTTQEEKTPAIEDQQPMDEEASSSKKQKVTITEEAPAHPTTVPASFAPSMTPARAPAGSPTSRRTLDNSITEGSTSKQQRDNNRTTDRQRRGQKHQQNHQGQKDESMRSQYNWRMDNKWQQQHVKIQQKQRYSND